jgi:hypothetical protein
VWRGSVGDMGGAPIVKFQQQYSTFLVLKSLATPCCAAAMSSLMAPMFLLCSCVLHVALNTIL